MSKIKNILIIGGNGLYDHGFIGPPLAMSSLPFQDTTISNNDVASRWGRLNFNIRHRFKNIEGLSAGINGNFMQSHSNFSLVWAMTAQEFTMHFQKP